MFSRRNSLRNSQHRNSGLNPAAAAAVVSFNQQNPRQNHANLAAGAAAEALRRHSLDAQGAQMVANFRRNSITSQSSRTNSMTRRNSLRSSSTVNRDQYGRAMSLTTTTVRQMGSFEIVKQEETAVRRQRPQQYVTESIYSLESLAEEPEYQRRPQPAQQRRQQRRQEQRYEQRYEQHYEQPHEQRYEQHHEQPHEQRYEQPHRSASNRGRVSFLDNTSEFHYEAYDNSESSALAAAAAVTPQRTLKPSHLPPIAQKPRSPMKSALKKSTEMSPISHSELEVVDPVYEEEEEEDEIEEDEHYTSRKNRPLSAVSELSTVTAKSHFSDEEPDAPNSPASPEESENEYEPAQAADDLTHEHYSESEDDHQKEFVPKSPENSYDPELPTLAKAEVSPVKRSSEGHTYARPNGQQPRYTNQKQNGNPTPNGNPNGNPNRPRSHQPTPNGAQYGYIPRSSGPSRGGFRSQPIGRQDQYASPQQQQQQQQQPRQHAPQGGVSRPNSFRPTRLSLPQNVGQQPGARTQSASRDSFVANPSYAAPARQLQPSPSIDSFNRIGSTNEIIERARNRACAFSLNDQYKKHASPNGISHNIEDDASSVNSDSSWKRSTTTARSKFGTKNLELSPPGRRPPSVTSSQFGGSRARLSLSNGASGGRTYSLRGTAPPTFNKNFRSRFDDSEDEDMGHAPTALPQLVTYIDDGTASGKPHKKPGFFKRLFSRH